MLSRGNDGFQKWPRCRLIEHSCMVFSLRRLGIAREGE